VGDWPGVCWSVASVASAGLALGLATAACSRLWSSVFAWWVIWDESMMKAGCRGEGFPEPHSWPWRHP